MLAVGLRLVDGCELAGAADLQVGKGLPRGKLCAPLVSQDEDPHLALKSAGCRSEISEYPLRVIDRRLDSVQVAPQIVDVVLQGIPLYHPPRLHPVVWGHSTVLRASAHGVKLTLRVQQNAPTTATDRVISVRICDS